MEGLNELRIGGQITAQVLDHLKEMVLSSGIRNGNTLDRFSETYILSKGGKPSCKGYRGYPATICLSINEEVAHSSPLNKKIYDGDLISIDLTVEYKGFHTDSAISFVVGNNPFFNRKERELVKITELCLIKAIKRLRYTYPNCYLADIPKAVVKTVRKKYGIIEDLGGHGIGKEIHQPPFIPNSFNRLEDMKFDIGKIICVEPMLAMGTKDIVRLEDGTYITKDGKPSAHFEHTLAITQEGIEVLTELKARK
jgi:methionyl aminopeptidase